MINGFVKTGSESHSGVFGGFKAYARYQVDLTFLMTTFHRMQAHAYLL